MSAYVVDDKTINRILSFIEYGRSEINVPGYLRGCLSQKGIPTYPLVALGRKMRTMNVAAVCARYERPGDMLPRAPYVFCSEPTTSPVQAYKSLSCYLYQCSEGTIPGRKLYQALQQVESRLAHTIVSELPEYDASDWG